MPRKKRQLRHDKTVAPMSGSSRLMKPSIVRLQCGQIGRLEVSSFAGCNVTSCGFKGAEVKYAKFSRAASVYVAFRSPTRMGFFVQLGEFLCKWPGLMRIWALLCKAGGATLDKAIWDFRRKQDSFQ
jgi:hypothetical protein